MPVAHVRRAAEHLAQRRAMSRRVQQAARDLVQQRREQVVVLPVDEHDVDGLVAELAGALQPAEAGADDDDPGCALSPSPKATTQARPRIPTEEV